MFGDEVEVGVGDDGDGLFRPRLEMRDAKPVLTRRVVPEFDGSSL